MTDRYDAHPTSEESDDAGRPLPDEWIRSLKQTMRDASNPPASVPRDAMWGVIEARIGRGSAEVVPLDRSSVARGGTAAALPRWAWGLAASVVLLAGIAIGRGSAPPAPATDAAVSASHAVDGRVVRDLASRHLAASETLLSFVGVDAARGEIDGDLATRGRVLLADTRMLLRVAPRGEFELRSLLGDLELVLAQLALLEDADFDDARRAEEIELLGSGLRRSDLLPRIQAALPRLDTPRRPMSSTD